MYVISKKRISIILICLLFGIFVYSYESIERNLDEQVQTTTSTPVSGKVIVIDAGHGVPDEGVAYCIKQKILSNYSFIKKLQM